MEGMLALVNTPDFQPHPGVFKVLHRRYHKDKRLSCDVRLGSLRGQAEFEIFEQSRGDDLHFDDAERQRSEKRFQMRGVR